MGNILKTQSNISYNNQNFQFRHCMPTMQSRPIHNCVIESSLEALYIERSFNSSFFKWEKCFEMFLEQHSLKIISRNMLFCIMIFFFSSTCTLTCRYISSSMKRAFFKTPSFNLRVICMAPFNQVDLFYLLLKTIKTVKEMAHFTRNCPLVY